MIDDKTFHTAQAHFAEIAARMKPAMDFIERERLRLALRDAAAVYGDRRAFTVPRHHDILCETNGSTHVAMSSSGKFIKPPKAKPPAKPAPKDGKKPTPKTPRR